MMYFDQITGEFECKKCKSPLGKTYLVCWYTVDSFARFAKDSRCPKCGADMTAISIRSKIVPQGRKR